MDQQRDVKRITLDFHYNDENKETFSFLRGIQRVVSLLLYYLCMRQKLDNLTSSNESVIVQNNRTQRKLNSFQLIIIGLGGIIGSAKHVSRDNYYPLFPKNQGAFASFGVTGMLHGATVVFFAYMGFDAVSTAAKDSEDPKTTTKTGILGSLAISVLIYIPVIVILVGIVPYQQLSVPYSLAFAANYIGMKWLAIAITVGALCSTASALLTQLIAQPRIFVVMATDGFLPQFFKNEKLATCMTGSLLSILNSILPVNVLSEISAVGTIITIIFVHLAVIIMRRLFPTNDDLPPQFRRTFKIWGGDSKPTLIHMAIWTGLGILIYFVFGIRYSKLRKRHPLPKLRET
ncbi:unnamed protein product [Didymodactylos carnosus]|uniref:Uncharacterized protein n=1 Tax=Didymodactylos carnosus TaxID=1234261 RepID=A0A814TMS6_9BILA|nr:unnamed protein product [Didymodactylos carnosus]CAF1252959.1 unnamed protein product [Didymodactylos carnosus]CAF3926981.1 unnamed protein product [Didymodactylos carnosus]CAF4060070.1 unnamed protein product [Didymodactylos carnosus]